MTTATVCAAALCSLVFVLGGNVSRLRGASSHQFPSSPEDPLFVAIRTHGNAAEYNPALALLIVLVALQEPSGWLQSVYVIGVGARLVHAVALITTGDMSRNTVGRTVAAVGTYATGIVLSGAAVGLALT